MQKVVVVLSIMACLLGGQVAQAGVIYRWVDVAPDPEAGRIDAYLEFGEEFWSLGGTFTSAPRDINPDTLEPYTGLERLHFDLIDGVIDPIEWTTNLTCGTFAGPPPISTLDAQAPRYRPDCSATSAPACTEAWPSL